MGSGMGPWLFGLLVVCNGCGGFVLNCVLGCGGCGGCGGGCWLFAVAVGCLQ